MEAAGLNRWIRQSMEKLRSVRTGDILTDYDKDSQSFIYDNDQIAGAVYGLYADENIKKDDGTLVWKKDELIVKRQRQKRRRSILQERIWMEKKQLTSI